MMMPHQDANSAASTFGWVFLVTNLLLEILSAVLEQLSSPSHPCYALSGMLVSLLAAVICILELVHRGLTQGVMSRRSSSSSSTIMIMWCFYYPSHSFCNIYGLLSAISQLILSAIKYSYHIRHANDPVNLSVLPVIFLACVVASKLITTNQQIHAADTITPTSTEANNLPQQVHIGDGETIIFIPTETSNLPQQQIPAAADATETININSIPQQQTLAETTISCISAEADDLYKPKLTPTLSRRSPPAQNQNQVSFLLVDGEDGSEEDRGTVAGPPAGTKGGGRCMNFIRITLK